jgi:predicted AlkP superfamily phosphohydrolase/phosphomutase
MSLPRVLILGLDGVGPDLIEQFSAEGHLPNLTALCQRGAWGPLRSTTPPTTLPAWTSFMTGATPSSHGVPDFTVREGYRVRFVGGANRALPTLFEHLELRGLTAGAAWFPATYPPEKLKGYQISGWDSPVTSRGDASFVHPAGLHGQLTRRFGGDHLDFEVIDEFSDDADWYLRTAEALPKRVRRRAEMAAWLLKARPVDVAAFYFGEADTAAHHLWAFHDPTSPRRPREVDPRLAEGLRAVYRALDEAVGLLIEAAGSQAAVVVLSDHGSGGASDVVVHLNRMLERAGLLRFKPPGRSWLPGAHWLRSAGPALVPPAWRRRLFRLGGGLTPSLAESRLRFGNIDWVGTRAFSEELTYAPSIWLNQRGREPRGVVDPGERAEACREVARAAATVGGPDGTPLIQRVIGRDELHRGPLAHLFPDMILELHPIDGYTPVCLPSEGRTGPVVDRLRGADLLGRKGRSLPGCHTQEGILMVAGEGVTVGASLRASLEDVAPVVAALAGSPGADWFEGGPVEGLPCPVGVKGSRAKSTGQGSYTPEEERAIAERLRLLGYLE